MVVSSDCIEKKYVLEYNFVLILREIQLRIQLTFFPFYENLS